MQPNKITHHVGRLNNTDSRCVIVYPQNPHNAGLALVVNTDNLPPRMHDALMQVVESRDAQTNPVLATVLQRRVYSDTGQDFMTSLHNAHALHAVPLDLVTLYPTPGNPIPLSMVVNNSMHSSMDDSATSQTPGMNRSGYHNRLNELQQPQWSPDQLNHHIANQRANNVEERADMAQNMLFEANMLEQSAAQKRQQAYAMAPSLRPTVQPDVNIPIYKDVPDSEKVPLNMAGGIKPEEIPVNQGHQPPEGQRPPGTGEPETSTTEDTPSKRNPEKPAQNTNRTKPESTKH